MRSCLNSYKMSLYGAKKVKVSDKLSIMCCKYNDFRGCIGKGFLRVGPEVCPEESQMFYTRIADVSHADVSKNEKIVIHSSNSLFYKMIFQRYSTCCVQTSTKILINARVLSCLK